MIDIGYGELAIVWSMFCLLGITEGAIINIDYNYFAVSMVIILYGTSYNKKQNTGILKLSTIDRN